MKKVVVMKAADHWVTIAPGQSMLLNTTWNQAMYHAANAARRIHLNNEVRRKMSERAL